jgi:hypothetical protein
VSDRENSTPIPEVLLAPGGRPFEKAVGWASALTAALLTAFDLFLVAPIASGRSNEPGLWALLAFSVALTYFFASVGYRLIRARPNSVGSVASPATWSTCFGLLVVSSLTFVVAAVVKRELLFAQGAALSGLLALLAFGAAFHFRRKQ